jgi:hypothetical protein
VPDYLVDVLQRIDTHPASQVRLQRWRGHLYADRAQVLSPPDRRVPDGGLHQKKPTRHRATL